MAIKLNISTASIILRHSDDWLAAVLEDTHSPALDTVRNMSRRWSRDDCATLGFAAGLYYGKRAERERRYLARQKKAR